MNRTRYMRATLLLVCFGALPGVSMALRQFARAVIYFDANDNIIGTPISTATTSTSTRARWIMARATASNSSSVAAIRLSPVTRWVCVRRSAAIPWSRPSTSIPRRAAPSTTTVSIRPTQGARSSARRAARFGRSRSFPVWAAIRRASASSSGRDCKQKIAGCRPAFFCLPIAISF
jgi:hypothetical protein